MTKKILAGLAAGLTLGASCLGLAQEGMPKPGPEHKKMAYFVGTWEFKGEMKSGPMGPGGPVTFKEICEMFEGGFALVCRSEGKGPTGPAKSISIMTYDTEKKAYTYTGVESNAPMFVAVGQENGGTWSWSSESKMGGQSMKMKVTVKQGGASSYEFRMDMATNGGPFAPMMEGKSTKTGK